MNVKVASNIINNLVHEFINLVKNLVGDILIEDKLPIDQRNIKIDTILKFKIAVGDINRDMLNDFVTFILDSYY